MKMAMRICSLFIWILASTSWAQTLVANADRTNIGLNETLNLVLEYDEQVDTRRLDLSALQQDFEILNSSTASQVSIVNGRRDVSTRWTLVLLPKSAGTAIVPSFQIDGNFSEAIPIQVEEVSATSARSQPLSVELLVSKNSVSVAEQLLVTIRLIAAPQVSNLSGDTLNIPGAETTLLNQNQYSEVVNGSTWQINEWTYAVFVDQPTTLEIPGQLFSGVIGSTRSIFDSFGANQRTLARSPGARVEIVSAPSGQYWFPASEVRIEEDWPDRGAGAEAEFRVGEPITRNITVISFGQRPETIPPLPQIADDQFKVYADQPELITQTGESHLIGIRSESAAIVPTRAGDMTLPEIRIPWFDVDDSIWKDAILPAQAISVLEAQSSASLAPPESFSAPEQLNLGQAEQAPFSSIWLWSTAAFAFLSLILAWLLVRQPKQAVSTQQSTSQDYKEDRLWTALKREFKKGTALSLRTSLESWCRITWPDESASPLQKLAEKLSTEAAKELTALDQAIYGKQSTETPSLNALQAELKVLRKQVDKKDTGASALAPLNPI